MSKYRKEFIIPYYEADRYGFIRPTTILTYMGETSSFHSESVGLGVDELKKNNHGWMLNRWKVRINSYPRVRDKIYIDTWASDFDKFYGNREFVIYDKDNNELVRASSLWVFLDILKKRPKRVPIDFYNKYNMVDEKAFPSFFDFENEYVTEEEMDFCVRKSDIDYNNHVNNVKYLNWMLEAIPVEIDDNYKLKEIDINYKKEIKLGNKIKSSYSKYEEAEGNTFIHQITTDGELNAYGRTIWIK